ncbi:hypothetical protein GCM10011351_10170 [Paraliobacillus quinghaiensis]|uniref:Uncharacterized protein n=1 Tax=Paraliobacillus quinghaiensis TaxID=470815 RepID=A0A917TL21_9BACI|nr:hypothetical protein [Paraliobacillus quinghaiensis]GGM26435.1 hypothetical protein GCM10011351_10170 [Paraliobacillus quinghaiensis]
MPKQLKEKYSPLYFLAALGSGGLAVSFFMYLMFMVKHTGRPMANFEHVSAAISGNNILLSITVVIALLGIIYFGIKHIQLLIWNMQEYRLYKRTSAYKYLRNSNAEVSLMAIPLTLGMTINVLFIVGAVFVPNLWSVVEYLFPVALLGFMGVGVYALMIFKDYFTRFMIHGDLDFVNNNNLSHMLTVFAFSMISVGFAAPAAMSHTLATFVIGLVMSLFFASLALLLMGIKMVLGFKSIFKQGIDKVGSPSVWISIPILTLLGITFVRLYMGVSHNLLHVQSPSALPVFLVLVVLVSLQIMFGFIGYSVLKNINYFKDYVQGPHKSPGSFALICPGVAFMVLGMFFIHWGFVKNGIVTQFSPIYFAMLLPFIYVQIKTIVTLFKLNRKLLKEDKQKTVISDENIYQGV